MSERFTKDEWITDAVQAIDALRDVPECEAGDATIAISDGLRARALHIRGVACPDCDGYGQKAYASTATWWGGIGGRAITSAVCDKCWGTGRTDETGVDQRIIEAKIHALEAKINEFRKQLGKE